MTQAEVLALLGGALDSVDSEARRGSRITRFQGAPLGQVLAELSLLERQAKDALSVRLVAMAKQVLVGRCKPDDYTRLCLETSGLI